MLPINHKINNYLIITNEVGEILFCNESFFKRLDYTEDEILKLNILDIIINSDNRFLKEYNKMDITIRFYSKSKEVINVNSNISVENFNQKESVIITGKEETTLYPMKMLEDILDNINMGTFVISEYHKLLYVNKTFSDMYNKKRKI